MDQTASNIYVVQPVEKALNVLTHVLESGHMVSLKSVSSALKIPKTTAFRYLQTLIQLGFLEQDGTTEQYVIGSRFHRLARNDASIGKARDLARPFMVGLTSEINCTVNLAAKGVDSIVYLDVIGRAGGFCTEARRGDANPMHSTALGKAILAFLPATEQHAYLNRPLTERTGRTMIEKQELEAQLHRVARNGYAMEVGENEDGAMCIGAPILNDAGYPLLAISVSVPLNEMTNSKGMEIGTRILMAARDISVKLGFDVSDRAAPRP